MSILWCMDLKLTLYVDITGFSFSDLVQMFLSCTSKFTKAQELLCKQGLLLLFLIVPLLKCEVLIFYLTYVIEQIRT